MIIFNKLILFILLISLSGCAKFVNLYEAQPISKSKTDGSLFENDTLKINYSFWSEDGVFSFSIYNKLNVPLYINWKKSALIKNNDKLNYWEDEILTRGFSTGSSVSKINSFSQSVLTSSQTFSNVKSVKPEQITFIAPNSTIYKIQYKIGIDQDGFNEKSSFYIDTFLSKDRTRPKLEKVKIKCVEYNESNSFIVFRNFLTFSTSDKFDYEFYIENSFFISRVYKIMKPYFYGTINYSKINLISDLSPFKTANRFYKH